MIILDIIPQPAPRMSSSDRWKKPNHPNPNLSQRPIVTKYFQYRTDITWLCKQQHYSLLPVLNIAFIIPMPKSWPQEKQSAMNGKPHTQKPDLDNLIKAFQDAFNKDDGYVHTIHASKSWGIKGQIIINAELKL